MRGHCNKCNKHIENMNSLEIEEQQKEKGFDEMIIKALEVA